MNNRYSIIAILGLCIVSPILHATTPQQMNQLRAEEVALKKRYDLIDGLNKKVNAAKNDNDLASIAVDGYNLSGQSIQKLTNEIYASFDKIAKIDPTYAKTKEPDMDKYLDITRAWMSNGKVGTRVEFNLGEDNVLVAQGINQLQSDFGKLIDAFKDLFPGELKYTSELETLSSVTEGHKKALQALPGKLQMRYPALGFETKELFLGLTKENKNWAVEITDALEDSLKKLKNQKDKSGKLVIDGSSTLAVQLKQQVAEVEAAIPKAIKDTTIDFAQKAVNTNFAFPYSPWVYVDVNYFTPIIKLEGEQDYKAGENDKGSFLNMIKGKNGDELVHNLVHKGGALLEDAGQFVTTLLASDRANLVLADEAAKNNIIEFAKFYGTIAHHAVAYIVKIDGYDTEAITADDESKKNFNQFVLKPITSYTEGFKKFYNANAAKLKLNEIKETGDAFKKISEEANQVLTAK